MNGDPEIFTFEVSTDSGATWTAENTDKYGSIIAVGSSGILYKYTGSGSWTSKTSSTSEIIIDVVYGNDKWVAAARSGTNSGMTALVSTDDGETWTNNQVHNDKVARGIGYGDGKFVALSERPREGRPQKNSTTTPTRKIFRRREIF